MFFWPERNITRDSKNIWPGYAIAKSTKRFLGNFARENKLFFAIYAIAQWAKIPIFGG